MRKSDRVQSSVASDEGTTSHIEVKTSFNLNAELLLEWNGFDNKQDEHFTESSSVKGRRKKTADIEEHYFQQGP